MEDRLFQRIDRFEERLDDTCNRIEKIDAFITIKEEQAEKNLQKRIFALEEMKSGSDPEDIKLAQETLEKSKLTLERVNEGTDQNDIDIQKLVDEQAKDS